MNDTGRSELARTDRTGWRKIMQEDEKRAVTNALDASSARDGQDTGLDGHVVLPREAQGRIGQHLRRVYGEILAEPLPDKFMKLLDDLAKSERSE